MAVPYTFGTATAAIPLSQLDSNFNTAITIGNTAVQLGNTITALANVSLVNATVTSLASPITAAQGGTGLATLTSNNVVLGNGTGNVLLVAPGTSGNALVSNGTTWSSSAVSANVSTVTGVLPVSNGGTGASSLTANNVLLGNGTSAVQIVAPGTSGNVLTSNGTTWTSAAAGGGSAMTLISTKTANNTAATISFTGLSGYDKYLLLFENVFPTTSTSTFNMVFGTGSGPTYITSNYSGQSQISVNTFNYNFEVSAASNIAFAGVAGGGLGYSGVGNTTVSSSGMSGVANLLGFTNGSDASCQIRSIFFSGQYPNHFEVDTYDIYATGNSTAKTAIKITCSSTIVSGTFSLYGISS